MTQVMMVTFTHIPRPRWHGLTSCLYTLLQWRTFFIWWANTLVSGIQGSVSNFGLKMWVEHGSCCLSSQLTGLKQPYMVVSYSFVAWLSSAGQFSPSPSCEQNWDLSGSLTGRGCWVGFLAPVWHPVRWLQERQVLGSFSPCCFSTC